MNAKKLLAMLLLTVVAAGCNRQGKSSPSIAETESKMSLLIKQHHFEEAAQLGLHTLSGRRSDATIYYLVALAYAERAQYEPDSRDVSLKLVDEYSQRSLSLDPSNELNRFNIAWVLEYAGDVSLSLRCKYYMDSRQLLDQGSDKLSSNAVLKNEMVASASRLARKLKDAHCE